MTCPSPLTWSLGANFSIQDPSSVWSYGSKPEQLENLRITVIWLSLLTVLVCTPAISKMSLPYIGVSLGSFFRYPRPARCLPIVLSPPAYISWDDVGVGVMRSHKTLIFPPSLSIEEVILLFNSKRPFRSPKNCHGYMLCRILVSKECKRLGENNKMIIAGVASYLWKESTNQEKLEYIDLSRRVKTHYNF
ncbi:hypothetical protein Glove_217g274 [Diversispora epigaea]|uniref:HMG box domain-containing protein n=1 Tax=Diversispora epigaea TaxID=1348612 RepID=A0A397IJP2_9GLOM|nr:hypothetical protein Glove_217g274 [Diversispora epigaea]